MVVFAIASAPIAIGLAYVPFAVKSFVLNKHNALDNTRPREDKQVNEQVDSFVARCNGAHLNQLESLAPYTAGLAVAISVGVPGDKLGQITATYITSRVAYNVAYLSPQVYDGLPRSVSWSVAMGSILWIWFAAIAKANDNNATLANSDTTTSAISPAIAASTASISCIHP